MNDGINVVGLYVDDQDEALAFYVGKLGFRVHTDVRNGPYRWLTVQHPDQPSFQLGLFAPGPPVHDAATAQPCARREPRAPCRRSCWRSRIAGPLSSACVRAAWSSRRSRWTAMAPWTPASATRQA